MTLGEYYFMGATLDTTELLNRIGMNNVLADVGKPEIPFMGCQSISEQIDQINSLAAKAANVSFIVAEAYESVTTGPAFSALSEAGVPQVHNWATPAGLYDTSNYIGLVDADGYGQGAIAAEILAYAMNYEGEVGMIYFSLEQWTNVMRYAGANDTFNEYPGIEVVARSGFTDPTQGYDIALGMLQANPEIDAIWATWMAGPATGAAEAVIALGRQDSVVVAAPDLGGVEGARNIADKNNPIIGCGEADCIEMGENSINAAFMWLLGGEEREVVRKGYFVSHVYPIVRANLVDMWSESGNLELFGALPSDILSLLEE
jgi:ribose transport system substrate-binding protein